MSDTLTDGTERNWTPLLCLIFGHDWYPEELTWKLQNNASHRKLWGDLCRRCHRFQPRVGGKERYEDTGTEGGGDGA